MAMPVMTGILEAKRAGKEVAVVLDADLSDNPSDIPMLIEPLLHNSLICVYPHVHVWKIRSILNPINVLGTNWL